MLTDALEPESIILVGFPPHAAGIVEPRGREMALRPQKHDDTERRQLLFGAQQRRPPPGGRNLSSAADKEAMETANSANVDGLRGRVGEMRHVRTRAFSVRPERSTGNSNGEQ